MSFYLIPRGAEPKKEKLVTPLPSLEGPDGTMYFVENGEQYNSLNEELA
jgi:hypothetical protein